MLHIFAFFSLFQISISSATSSDYCLSLRGNGELLSAHWGALATVIEKEGLPMAQAGGSSASISLFLIDSAASSSLAKESPKSVAFLLKALEGVAGWVQQQKEWQDFSLLLGDFKKIQNREWLKNIQDDLNLVSKEVTQKITSQDLQEIYQRIQSTLKTAQNLQIINTESLVQIQKSVQELATAKSPQDLQKSLHKAQFYTSELYKTYQVFGQFNAEADHNLFFRSGIVNFDGLAQQIGRIGDLLSSASLKDSLWSQLYNDCHSPLVGKIWSEMVQEKPSCQGLLENVITHHFRNSQNSFADKSIGHTIVSFPITSVLVQRAYQEAQDAQALYHQNLDPEFGKNFRLEHPEDVRFGYWGSSNDLKKIEKNLNPQDAKSERFLALNEASWSEALRLSPAEPGLSAIREFSFDSQKAYSVGGWPDLTPTLVLKAYGCEKIIHVTRRGGESLFAQGVAKRLLNLDRSWDLLRTTPDSYDKNWVLNNQGDPSDLTSQWAKLYNLANEKSSLRQSLGAADAILCTNWNAFDIKDGITGMIHDAYNSPFYVNPQGTLASEKDILQPVLDTQEMNAAGYPEYVGCF